MVDISFVAKVQVSERHGLRGGTKYYRLRISPDDADALQFIHGKPLVDNEKVQVTITRFRPKGGKKP